MTKDKQPETNPDERRLNATDELLASRFAQEPEKRGPGRPPKDKIAEVNSALSQVWTQAVCSAIISKQILTPNDVPKACAIADAVVEVYKVKFVGQ